MVVNVIVLQANTVTSKKLEAQTAATIKETNARVTASKRVSELSDEKLSISTTLKKTEEKSKRLERENADLKAAKQAKERAAKLAAAKVAVKPIQAAPVAAVSAPQVQPTGNCSTWLANAGVTDTASAMTLINRESGCNPNAVNPTSGACGVGQELPCGKSGCGLGNGACQVAWMRDYVNGRYGSFAAALAHSNQLGWY